MYQNIHKIHKIISIKSDKKWNSKTLKKLQIIIEEIQKLPKKKAWIEINPNRSTHIHCSVQHQNRRSWTAWSGKQTKHNGYNSFIGVFSGEDFGERAFTGEEEEEAVAVVVREWNIVVEGGFWSREGRGEEWSAEERSGEESEVWSRWSKEREKMKGNREEL